MNGSGLLRRMWEARGSMVLVAGALGVTGLVLGMQSQPKASDNIVIKDAKGQKRIEIGVFNDEPGIVMYDRNGRQRIRLSMLEEEEVCNSFLRFLPADGNTYTAEFGASDALSGQDPEPISQLVLGGPRQSGVSLTAGVMPQIELEGGKPDERGLLTLNVPAGRPRISMSDKHSKERLLMRLAPDGSPALFCKDKTDKVIWQAPPEAKDSSPDKPKKEKPEEKK